MKVLGIPLLLLQRLSKTKLFSTGIQLLTRLFHNHRGKIPTTNERFVISACRLIDESRIEENEICNSKHSSIDL
jgi:hypothetical protein